MSKPVKSITLNCRDNLRLLVLINAVARRYGTMSVHGVVRGALTDWMNEKRYEFGISTSEIDQIEQQLSQR